MSWWSRLVQRWSRREPATPLALFRIGTGLGLLLTFLPTVRAELIVPLLADRAHGGYRALGGGGWLVQALGGPTAQVAHSLVAFSLLGGLLLVVGLGGRLVALCSLQISLAAMNLNGHAGGSHDLLLSNALWLLVLAPSTHTLSLDCRIRTGRWRDDRPVAAWVRDLVMFQIVLVYWTTGLQKLSSHWVPGGEMSALYYIFQQPSWQRFDMSWLAPLYPLTQLATLLTWLWEVLSPAWLLATWATEHPDRVGRMGRLALRLHLREVFVALGVGMHLVLLVLLDVGPFSVISLAFYPCFYRHEDLLAAWRWLARPARALQRQA